MPTPARDGVTLLLAWAEEHELRTHRAIAARCDVSQSTVTRALNRTRSMDIYSAAKIEKATGGVVPASSWALVKIRQGDKAA